MKNKFHEAICAEGMSKKMLKLLITCAIIILTSFPVYAHESDDYIPKKYNVGDTRFYQSESVLVMDADTGDILYETLGFTRRYPASITKVMTALLVLEHVSDLNERVIFSEYAVDIPWYASRMGIEAGESISVLEGLYGIMLPSGNEVARALAEHVAGSVSDFVAMMNQRAWELGAYYTRFVNPCGLPGDGQFVTAYDVALIMLEAIKHPLFVDIISTAYFELFPTENYDEPRRIRNSNRMVRPAEPEFNEYVVGGKTGFTNAAQHTLVTYARRGERSLIISVLYAPRGATFTDTAALMDYVFDKLENIKEEPEENPEVYEPTIPVFRLTTPPVTPPSQANNLIGGVIPDDNAEYISQIPPPMYHQYISNMEAVVVAAASLCIVIVGILFIGLFTHRIRTCGQ